MYGLGRYLAALMAIMLLAACGGGGGNSPVVEALPPVSASKSDIWQADPVRTRAAAEAVSRTRPRFGSVTQSSNGLDGVATDQAQATFSAAAVDPASSFPEPEGSLRVEIERQDKPTLVLESVGEGLVSGGFHLGSGGAAAAIEAGRRILREWAILNVTERTALLGRVFAEWRWDDPADYLAAGYWMRQDGSGFGGASPTVAGVEAGAFIDGPEYRSPPSSLPTLGTASYRGTAYGLSTATYGTGIAGAAPGARETGEFRALAELTADFADQTITGCIGCEPGGLSIQDGIRVSPSGVVEEVSFGSQYRIHLNGVSINSDGTFSGGNVTVTNTTLAQPITSSGGSWGGRFSNRPLTTGEPRAVAGTFGSRVAIQGGTEANFVGVFGAGER